MRLTEAYVADPFILAHDAGYYLFGTTGGATAPDREFAVLHSLDLLTWTSLAGPLHRPDAALGDAFWAPEVVQADDRWWMYYSVGHGDAGHHIRVAVADHPAGPYDDLGIVLTPDERFAIDPHPFQDADGTWYLYFARDVLDHERAGTHLAVAPLHDMTRLGGPTTEVLAPSADWQVYARDRPMYGGVYNWHTLEGPSVLERHDRYWLTFSGGAWTGRDYQVSWAVADNPLGPWQAASGVSGRLLATDAPSGLIGPGHNSLCTDPQGRDVIVFHSWDSSHTRREPHVMHIDFTTQGPHLRPYERTCTTGPPQNPSAEG